MEAYNILDTPFKEPFPSFPYDLGKHCKTLLMDNPFAFPEYLAEFYSELSKYARLVDITPIKPLDYSRTYIFDNRLNPMFAAKSISMNMADSVLSFINKTHEYSDYITGDAETALMIGKFDNPTWNLPKVNIFINSYGLLPSEDFALSKYIVFEGNEIICSQPLTTWQVHMLLERLRRYNQIDLNKLKATFFQ